MTFNSIEFGIFFPIVFLLYWLVFQRSVRARNIFLIAVSYFFYGWWDWRFLGLLMFSTLVDYYAGKKIYESADSKRNWLWLSLAVNLGILTVFKYFGFFVTSFVDVFSLAGMPLSFPVINIILPVGLSFYTFQSLSYTLDLYYGRMKPADSIVDFAAYISFFPQLVAGPIERARYLLPQFTTPRPIDYEMLRSGLLLICFGLFKKIVLADRLARFVDASYADIPNMKGMTLVTTLVFFAFQLYLDFSAYSDIAIGTARTLGFNLTLNFNRPYLASSFSDFWKRWHISLSTWFRDYVFVPLGGSRAGQAKWIRNILIVFVVSGLWHGASWNFLIWGAVNGLFVILFDKLLIEDAGRFRRVIQGVLVFCLWTTSLVFFRSPTLSSALEVFGNFTKPLSSSIYQYGLGPGELMFTLFLLLFFIAFEILIENRPLLPQWFALRSEAFRWAIYLILIFSVILLGSYGTGLKSSNFIYFQF